MRRSLCAPVALSLLAAFPSFPHGAESTQILGIAEGATVAVVPDVCVTAVHAGAGPQRQVATGESGNHVITNIVPGEHVVRADPQGFRAEAESEGARRMKLSVGTISEAVEVSARGAILNTDDATI